MKEKPITFSTPMVQAIQRGEKTMTRRILKLPTDRLIKKIKDGPWAQHLPSFDRPGETFYEAVKLRYQVGDLLWVKEGVVTHASIPQVVGYVADGCTRTEYWEKPRNSRFMPKWAARIWLEVTAVKVERLHDISTEDCEREGIVGTRVLGGWDFGGFAFAKDAFRDLWESINGKGSWDQNPWVEAYTFRVVEG